MVAPRDDQDSEMGSSEGKIHDGPVTHSLAGLNETRGSRLDSGGRVGTRHGVGPGWQPGSPCWLGFAIEIHNQQKEFTWRGLFSQGLL